MKPTFTVEAEADLLSIGRYIARENPQRAGSYVEEIIERCDEVASAPNLFRRREEWGETIRAARFGPYLILFESSAVEVIILRVVRGSQDIAALLKNPMP